MCQGDPDSSREFGEARPGARSSSSGVRDFRLDRPRRPGTGACSAGAPGVEPCGILNKILTLGSRDRGTRVAGEHETLTGQPALRTALPLRPLPQAAGRFRCRAKPCHVRVRAPRERPCRRRTRPSATDASGTRRDAAHVGAAFVPSTGRGTRAPKSCSGRARHDPAARPARVRSLVRRSRRRLWSARAAVHPKTHSARVRWRRTVPRE